MISQASGLDLWLFEDTIERRGGERLIPRGHNSL